MWFEIHWPALLFWFALSCGLNWIWNRAKTRPIVYKMESDKWLYIEENPFPENFEGQFFITDGKEVDWHWVPYYDNKGTMIMSTRRHRPVIAWMPLPQPPKPRES